MALDVANLTTKQSNRAIVVLGALAGLQTAEPIIGSVALVKASQGLHFSSSMIALASGISTIALAATVIASGLLADRLGRKRVLLAALVLTAIGDLVVAGSTGAPMYLIGQVLAGIGLGAVFGAAYAYVQAVAPNRIGAALGTFAAMGGVVTMVAGLAGGSLASSDWRLAYAVLPILCLAGLFLAARYLPKVKGSKTGRIDVVGLVLIAVITIGILDGISHASTKLVSPETWLPILIGLVALVIFAWYEARTKTAVFPIRLFKSPVFVASVLVVLCWNLAQAAIILQLSNLWQYIQHYNPTAVSFGELPLNIISIIGAIMVGRSLRTGKSPRTRIALGFGMVALGFAYLGFVRESTSYFLYLPALLLIGYGLPYAVVTSGQLFMNEAPPKDFGPVTSSKTTLGQFGYSLGLAGSMVLVNGLTAGGIIHKLMAAGVPPDQTGQGLDVVTQYASTGSAPSTNLAQTALHAASGSYLHAFNVVMLVMAAVVALTAFIAYHLLGRRPAAAPQAA